MSSLLEWKQEPVSPQQYVEDSWLSDDALLYLTSVEPSKFEAEDDFQLCESKAEVASKLLENLEQLEDLDEWIKEEPYSNWFQQEKILPIFDDVAPVPAAPTNPVKIEQIKIDPVPDTQTLLQEFENVFGAVEMTHETLTPPQSPPYEPLLTALEPVAVQPAPYPALQKHVVFPVAQKQILPTVSYNNVPMLMQIDYPPATPQPDIAHELAVVDELVRTRVDSMVQSPFSPCSSSNSGSSFGDCSSDDPEWIPETVPSDEGLEEVKQVRKRSKPYSRSTNEDKKSRKKEQNKNAATRYRMKKKAEVEEIFEEERGLSKQNEELEHKIGDLQREIKYLKGLMRDLFKAKGLIN